MKNLSASALSVPTVHGDGTVNPVIPNIISFDADPNSPLISAPDGSLGLRTDVPGVYIKYPAPTNWTLLAASNPSSSLTLAAPSSLGDGSVTASLNFSTEGTIDWFAPYNPPGNGSKWVVGTTGTDGAHEKLGGLGYLSVGAAYVANGISYNVFGPVSSPTGGAPTFQRTTNEDDDNCELELSSDTHYNAISLGGTALNVNNRGPGFRLVVPALATQSVLRVYTDQFLCPVTCYASLLGTSRTSNQTSTVASMVDTPGGGNNSNAAKYKWTITYQAAAPAWLEVLFLITGIPSAHYHAPYLAFIGATIAAS